MVDVAVEDKPLVREDEPPQGHEVSSELERLKELNELKTTIINSASHELRTPLTPIRLQLHLLKNDKRGPLTPEQRSSIDVVDRNVERLYGLVTDLLDVARIQSARFPVASAPVDLESLIREAYDSFGPPAEAAGLKMDVHTSPGLVVIGDAKRLLQVLFNFLGNSIKFTDPGGHVLIETRRTEHEAILAVRDSGAGFAPDDHRKLFLPFSQFTEIRAGATGGAGLGLYICKGIIDLHGGSIWARSDGKGLGSVFGFNLPLAPLGTKGADAGPGSPEGREGEFERRIRRLI